MRSCPRSSAIDSTVRRKHLEFRIEQDDEIEDFCLSLSNLAADCFPARNSGPSVSMVITGRSRHS